MEMIASHPGMLSVDEPLHPRNVSPHAFGEPENWDHLLPANRRIPALEPYIEKIVKGRLFIGTPRPGSRNFRFKTDRIVLKMLRCQDLVEWFETTFDLQIVLLIRHPIATNLSRKISPRLPLFLENQLFCNRHLTREQRQFAADVLKKGTDLEKNVLDWCLQLLPVFQSKHANRWCQVFYEPLVANTAEEMTRIAKYLELADTTQMLANSLQPSVATTQSDLKTRKFFDSRHQSEDESDFLLSKWRSSLKAGDEEQAFRILHEFGIDCYSVGNDWPATVNVTANPGNNQFVTGS